MSQLGYKIKQGIKLIDSLSEGKPHVRPLLRLPPSLAPPPFPLDLPRLTSARSPFPVFARSQSSVTDWVDILTGDNYALDELDGVAELVEAV